MDPVLNLEPVKGFDPALCIQGFQWANTIRLTLESSKHRHPWGDQVQILAGLAGSILGNVIAMETRRGPAHLEAFLAAILVGMTDVTLSRGVDLQPVIEILRKIDTKSLAGQAAGLKP